MSYVALEKIVPNDKTSIFKTVLAAAARANELAGGAQPLVKPSSRKVATIALEEMASGKVHYVETKAKSKKTLS